MADKLVISLLTTNFAKIIDEYEQKWNDHIEWVKQSLDDIVDKNKIDDETHKTPQTKKSARKNAKSIGRSTSLSRPSANIINSVITNKTARITRSTSRFLKQLNMINEDGNLIKVNQNEMIKDLKNFDDPSNEQRINLVNHKINEKKVSFDSTDIKPNDKQQEQNRVDEKIAENKSVFNSNDLNNFDDPSNEQRINLVNHEIIEKKVSYDSTDIKPNDKQQEQNRVDEKIAENKSVFNSNDLKENDKEQKIDEEWLTDDESSYKRQSVKSSKVNNDAMINAKNTNSKNVIKSGLPELRVALKRSATLKSASKPTIDFKRNKTSEFTTPQSIKKLARPLNFGSANKKLIRLPTATVTKSAFTSKATTYLPKITHQQTATNHLGAPSHTNHQRLIPSSTLSSSSISSSSQSSLKTNSLATVQPAIKTLIRINSNNSEGKQQRCFGESALKQKLEEEKRKKMLELKIAKEEDAKLKKDKFLQQRVLETKSKREERERKVREGKLLNDSEAEQRRIAEQKKQEELKRQLMLQKQAEEVKKQAEEAKKQAEEVKKQAEEAKKQAEEAKKQAEEAKKQAKKVEFDNDTNRSNEDLQTKLFEKLEKKLIEDKLKQKETPIKQLIVEAVGKKNAGKSLYKPEIDPSLDVIDLSLSTDDSSLLSSEDEQSNVKETTSNCTFIKDINNKAFSSTFIKSSDKAASFVPINAQNLNFKSTSNPNNNAIQSIDIVDICSSDEDEDVTVKRSKAKKIACWAMSDELGKAIRNQFSLNARARENAIKLLFSSIDSNVKLEQVFYEQKIPEKFKNKTRSRGSSACWSSPPQTHIDKSFSTFY